MFEDPETRRKRWSLIAIGSIIGAILGFILDHIGIGIILGYFLGVVIGLAKYGIAKPVNKEQKRLMRLMLWSLSASAILGAIAYGWMTQDAINGIGAGIAMVLSVGLSLDSLYDERIGQIFSKAARNSYIVLTFCMALVGFLDEAILLAYPELMILLGNNPIVPLLWVSYAIFAGSWLFHSYVPVG